MMENKLEFMVNEFDDYSKKLLTYIKNNKDNAIYILDLELPNGDGIDVARYIRDEIGNRFGYSVKKGNPILIKMLSNATTEEEVDDDDE